MCRFRVSLFNAKQTALSSRNCMVNERPLSEAQIEHLVNALEDMVSDLETIHRKRWRRKWTRRLRMDAGPARAASRPAPGAATP